MTLLRFAGALALAFSFTGSAAEAYTLEQAAKPAEYPPAGFSGDVYVDSRGCAYVRGKVGSNVSWVPWVGDDRKTVMCGMTPTNNVVHTAAAPPPPPPPPAAVSAPAASTRTEVAAAAAPAAKPVAPEAPAEIRTVTVSCPADGSTARVRISGATIGVRCGAGQTRAASYIVRSANGERTRMIVRPAPAPVPAPAAPVATASAPTVPAPAPAAKGRQVRPGDVLAGGRVVIGGAGSRAGRFAPLPSTPAPAGAATTAPLRLNIPAPSSPAVAPPAPRVVIPEGYKSAWKDDRLNPERGPRSARGDAQMAALLDVRHVPMRAINPVPAQGLIQAPASGLVVSTKSRPAAPAPAPASAGYRYVQVGLFNVTDNATRALATLRQMGLKGRIVRTASGANLVVAGPYDQSAALKSALAAARRAFPDAYLRS